MPEFPQLASDDFSRRFVHRGPGLMWFLGAGASAAAGVPTANDLIWNFKQHLYVSQRRVALQSVSDLSNPAVRRRLQAHIDGLGTMPGPGDPAEYSALFEATYPAEADRRSLLDGKVSGASPSYGHIALATLMRAEHARVLWTTNFDSLMADACARVFGSTARLTTVALDAPSLLRDVLASERWPIEVKLHGDFRSRHLKNTSDELRQQDAELRAALVGLCGRFGLVVSGYSGRDNSVMDSLHEAAEAGGFPAGLFWLHRREDPLLPRVLDLLDTAARTGVEAAAVEIESFDETLRDLVRLLPALPAQELSVFAEERRRWTSPPKVSGRGGWPVIRLNALPVETWPTTCRRVVCDIGGWAEVRAAVEAARADIVFARVSAGVLAFGPDSEVRRPFETRGISEFDLHPITESRLRRDHAGERALIIDAMARALTAGGVLRHAGRRGSTRLLAPSEPAGMVWKPLRQIVGDLSGTVGGKESLRWREGIGLRLEWASGRLWLLFDSLTVFDGVSDEDWATATDFARERSVKRYNRQLNDLIDFWAGILAHGGREMRAFGEPDGVDATFRLNTQTAFSRRATA